MVMACFLRSNPGVWEGFQEVIGGMHMESRVTALASRSSQTFEAIEEHRG